MSTDETIRSAFDQSAFFSGLPRELLDEFIGFAKLESFGKGEVVCKKGEPGDAIYIVVAGEARVHDGELTFSILRQGQTFGELAAFEDKPRTASITALCPLSLVSVQRDTIVNLMSRFPDSGLAIVRSLCTCLRDRTEEVIEGAFNRVRMERELQIGRQIQSGFIPDRLPEIDGWTVNTHFQAAKEVAGDFYDVFEIEGHDRIGVIIADVCDKGVGAALFMTLFRSLLRSMAKLHEFADMQPSSKQLYLDRPDLLLARCVNFTNNYIASTHGHTSMFATLFFGLLEPATGHMYYINAGHEKPFILGSGEIIGSLENTGPVVGLFQNSEYGISEMILAKGQALFAYTDGVPDAIDDGGIPFGMERLNSVLMSTPATGLMDKLLLDIQEYIGDADQFDDITVLVLARN